MRLLPSISKIVSHLQSFKHAKTAVKSVIKILDIENTIPNNRFNDAKVDRSGRIWAGSMDDNEKLKTGWLYRIDSNLNFTKCDGPYVITNGPAMNFEGNITGYGQVFAQIKVSSISSSKTSGTLDGNARTILNDGTLISSPIKGSWKRFGSLMVTTFNL